MKNRTKTWLLVAVLGVAGVGLGPTAYDTIAYEETEWRCDPFFEYIAPALVRDYSGPGELAHLHGQFSKEVLIVVKEKRYSWLPGPDLLPFTCGACRIDQHSYCPETITFNFFTEDLENTEVLETTCACENAIHSVVLPR